MLSWSGNFSDGDKLFKFFNCSVIIIRLPSVSKATFRHKIRARIDSSGRKFVNVINSCKFQ